MGWANPRVAQPPTSFCTWPPAILSGQAIPVLIPVQHTASHRFLHLVSCHLLWSGHPSAHPSAAQPPTGFCTWPAAPLQRVGL